MSSPVPAPTPISHSHITCLCGAISLPGSPLLAYPFFPLPDSLCHCNPCRLTSGALGMFFPNLTSAPPASALAKCTAYASTTTGTRYFCSICGAKMFIRLLPDEGAGDGVKDGDRESWFVASGTIESSSPGTKIPNTIQLSRHIYVSDTGDGGLAPRLLTLGNDNSNSNSNSKETRSIPCWTQVSPADNYKSQTGDLSPTSVTQLHLSAIAHASSPSSPSSTSTLSFPARCHCTGVSLRILPADYTSRDTSVPTLFHPPSGPRTNKYMASICACRSCRLATGTSLVPWTYIPPANIRDARTGERVRFGREREEEGQGGRGKKEMIEAGEEGKGKTTSSLKHYWSTADQVCRSFCGRCGATVFFWDEQRPEVVDLAAGLLGGREPNDQGEDGGEGGREEEGMEKKKGEEEEKGNEGAMARRWIEWNLGRCSHAEECVDEEILGGILSSNSNSR